MRSPRRPSPKLLCIAIMSVLVSINSNATVLERVIVDLKTDGTIITSVGDNFSSDPSLNDDDIGTLRTSVKIHQSVSLVLSGTVVTQAFDLQYRINQDALKLAIRAEKAAKPPGPR